jgi:hypothetical protein
MSTGIIYVLHGLGWKIQDNCSCISGVSVSIDCSLKIQFYPVHLLYLLRPFHWRISLEGLPRLSYSMAAGFQDNKLENCFWRAKHGTGKVTGHPMLEGKWNSFYLWMRRVPTTCYIDWGGLAGNHIFNYLLSCNQQGGAWDFQLLSSTFQNLWTYNIKYFSQVGKWALYIHKWIYGNLIIQLELLFNKQSKDAMEVWLWHGNSAKV